MSAYANMVWTLPDGVFAHDEIKSMYSQVADSVRQELDGRGSNVFDHLLTERIVFAYCLVRDKDMTASGSKAWAHDRVRRESLKDFFETVERLQRRWIREDWQDAAESTKRKLATALNEALLDIDPSVASHLRDKLADEMMKVGI